MLASVTLVNGTSVIQVKKYLKLQVVWIQMNCFGNPIGHVAEEDGKKKDVQGHTIKDHSLKTTRRSQESMNGLIGECRSSLRK